MLLFLLPGPSALVPSKAALTGEGELTKEIKNLGKYYFFINYIFILS